MSVVSCRTQRGGGAVIADSPQEEALFGLWLRRRRRALDLTQKALARRVGCSPSTIRKLEADMRHPSRYVARALAEVLGVAQHEHDAFIRFARGGWADRPPANAVPDFERPWLVGGRSPSSAAMAGDRPQATSEPAPEATVDGAGQVIPEAPHVVAREGELAWLERELERALGGDGHTALVAGEAGQGKTALMVSFAAWAQSAYPDLLVAIGTCNAYTGRGDPFLPFRQVLAQLTGHVPAGRHLDTFQRERAARLSRAAPLAVRAVAERGPHLLGRLVPGPAQRGRLDRARADPVSIATAGGPGFGPAALHRNASDEQQALRAEAADALTALSDDMPLLLVLDDLHWVDDSSAELLLHLSAVATGHRLLVLGAYRPAGLAAESGEGHLPHPLIELTRRHATSLDLAGSDGRAFVDAWLDRQENVLDSDFRASLWRQTGGHPLFTIELLRAMQEGGDLIEDDDGRWLAIPDLHWDRMPSRVADAIAARVERLDRLTRDILRVASVEGGAFTAEVVAAVLDLDPRRVTSTLGRDLDRRYRLIAAVDVERGPAGLVSRYRFRHDLIQRYVYDTIDPGERAYLHEGVATALEALLGEGADPVALAFHYASAHAPARAAGHHRKAGDQARQAHALDQAIDHYQAALAAWPDRDPLTRAALLRDLGEVEADRLRYAEAMHYLGEASAAFEAAGDPRSAATALVDIARFASFTGPRDYAGMFEAVGHAIALLEPLGESAELADALSFLSYGHTWIAEFAEGAALGERAVAMSERVGARDVLPIAMVSLGTALPNVDPPSPEEGRALLERSSRRCEELGLVLYGGLAMLNLGILLEELDDPQGARARYLQGLEFAKRNRTALHEHQAQYLLWWTSWTHGDWSGAFERVSHVRALADGSVLEFEVPLWFIGLMSSELDLGRAEQAREMLQRHEDTLDHLARPVEQLASFGVRLRTAVALGDDREAARMASSVADAVTPVPVVEHRTIVTILEALRYLVRRSAEGNHDRIVACQTALERLERHFGSHLARASLLEARGLKAATVGLAGESATFLSRAADAWQAGTFPLHEARARATAAQALRRWGRDAEAGSEHERARTVLASLAEQIPSDEHRSSFTRVADAMLLPRGA